MKKYLNTEEFLRRKRLIAAYLEGLETGDTDLTAAVWLAAATDAELERILDEINFDYEAEFKLTSFAKDANLVRELAKEHFSSAFEEQEKIPYSLTVSDVAKQLEISRSVSPDDETVNRILLENKTPLPKIMSLNEIKRLASELKIAASNLFWRKFHGAAMLLRSNRSQEMAMLAARQKRLKKQREKSNERGNETKNK